jgi:hypothetical protein
VLTGAILISHLIWYFDIPGAELYIITWAVTFIMEFGVLWFYPRLNLPLLPVDQIIKGEFDWALLTAAVAADIQAARDNTMIKAGEGLAWCRSFDP